MALLGEPVPESARYDLVPCPSSKECLKLNGETVAGRRAPVAPCSARSTSPGSGRGKEVGREWQIPRPLEREVSPPRGTKPNGDPCKQNALPGKSYCLWHSDDPEDVAEVQRRSSKGDKTTTSIIAGKITAQRQELADLKEELRDLARSVRSGDVTAQVGSTLV